MSMRDLINGEAELDDEENDESFDEDTGEARARKVQRNDDNLDDSSEEEDDEDEEAAAAVGCSRCIAMRAKLICVLDPRRLHCG